MCTHCMGSCRRLSQWLISGYQATWYYVPLWPCVCKLPWQGNSGYLSTRTEGPFRICGLRCLHVLQAVWPSSEQVLRSFQGPSLFPKSVTHLSNACSPFFCLLSFCRLCNHPVLLCTVLPPQYYRNLCCCFYHLEQPPCIFLPHQLCISSTFVFFSKVGFLICICLLIFFLTLLLALWLSALIYSSYSVFTPLVSIIYIVYCLHPLPPCI